MLRGTLILILWSLYLITTVDFLSKCLCTYLFFSAEARRENNPPGRCQMERREGEKGSREKKQACKCLSFQRNQKNWGKMWIILLKLHQL